jgi:hypothetical protein
MTDHHRSDIDASTQTWATRVNSLALLGGTACHKTPKDMSLSDLTRLDCLISLKSVPIILSET